MTPLRIRMIEDMRTAGLTSGTQSIYLDGVRRLAAHYGRSPDLLSEEEVRAYLIGLRERGVALGTFKTNHGGIQFLYRQTLDLDWQLFGKKRSARRSRGVCRLLYPTARSGPSWAVSATPCTGRAFP
jgi:hypothetical protein